MEYKLVLSNSFKKDYKLVKKQGKDVSLLDKIIPLLLSGKKLPAKYKDHELKGKMKLEKIYHKTGFRNVETKLAGRAKSLPFHFSW